MSELINTRDNRATIRWKLLTGASALVLAAYVSSAGTARAEDADHPVVWIDLGGQLAWNENGQEDFLPPFLLTMPRPPFEVTSPGKVERQAPTSWDWDAKLSFQPEDSKWVLSAGIRYGKSSRHEYLDQLPPSTYFYEKWAFQNITADTTERHTILDFQAGRDFGLGTGVSSTVSLGVRFAQFSSRAHTFIESQPQNFNWYAGTYTRFDATFNAKRSFSGIGPSLSWDGTAAVAGNTTDGQIDIDWGINAALLFGRQSVRGHHKTTGIPYVGFYGYPSNPYYHSAAISRSKNVTVPNLGGYAAVSWSTSNAKVSFGYRADVFFGAIDGGIDAAKKENRGFYGPFASISIGLGD